MLYLFRAVSLFGFFVFDGSNLQAELGKPSILHPDKGKVSIFVDCSPTAEPTFEVGDLL
jgi:hypothetical protein